MRIVRKKLEGEVSIIENSELHGIIDGNAIVENNILFRVYGTINGNLVINTGATVILHGHVKRNVINAGGTIQIFGKVDGQVDGEHSYHKREDASANKVG